MSALLDDIAVYHILPNCSRWKSFVIIEMVYNLLENTCGCMVVLCGQTLLHREIIAVSLEQFCGYRLIHEKHEASHPKQFTVYGNC